MTSKCSSYATDWPSVINHIVYERNLRISSTFDGGDAGFTIISPWCTCHHLLLDVGVHCADDEQSSCMLMLSVENWKLALSHC